MNILRCENVTKTYQLGQSEVKALDGLNLAIEKGKLTVIVGASGSGKSTLLHMLGGVDRPTSGKIWIEDTDISTLSEKQLSVFRRRKVGLIYQFYNLIPTLDVKQNILLPLLLDGQKPEEESFRELSDTLGLSDRLSHLPSQLSGGQQQRVLLARALCAAQKILLLDEPVSGLDPRVTAEMYQLIRNLNKKDGITIIMISHDIAAAVKYATHILHIVEHCFFGTKKQYLESSLGKAFTGQEGEDE